MANLSDDLLVFTLGVFVAGVFIPEWWIGLIGITTLTISVILYRYKNE
jgi:hypothetical protein